MTRGVGLTACVMVLAGCSTPQPTAPASPPPTTPDRTPAIVSRGDAGRAGARAAPAADEGPDPRLIEALRRAAAQGDQDHGGPDEAPSAPGDLPVVLGDTQGFGLRVQAASAPDGTWTASVDLQERAGHGWAAVVVELALLAGRRPLEATRVTLKRVERRARASDRLEGAFPPGADRVRVRVVATEPQPGETEVAWRPGRLRGFDVRRARLLRTRGHELDAILELGGGPFEHVAWSGADFEVTFLDHRGQAITHGRARLIRGQGPPWRLHVVGGVSRTQVALIQVACEDLRFD